ncbi:MAG: sodium:proton antiporter, partial [Enterovirga sp.]|nr:sodium:proton antiporter [Enterovirga sp.]
VPGAVGQIAIATLLGMALAWALGWPLGAGLVFGLALSVASTVVLLRALQERRLVETEKGKIAVGWLIVEDLAMVLTLVLLPAVAGLLGGHSEAEGAHPATSSGILAGLQPQTVWGVLGLTVLKLLAFLGVMLVVGRRVIPWVLHYVAHTGSRELFRLSVLAIALGVAFGAAELFGVSFALGAFFAGMILAESELSHRAAQETLPLRDAFAVLFFVSVGMLFDPGILVRQPGPVLATVAIIIVGKSIAAFAIVRLFGHPLSTALVISASLAQIGEFSFILATLGITLGLLPEAGRDLILAGALISILLNPLLFVLLDRLSRTREAEEPAVVKDRPLAELAPTNLTGHVVLVGHGRVGGLIASALKVSGTPFLVVDEREAEVERLRADGVEAILGNANTRGLLAAANLRGASCLVSAIPNPFEASNLIQAARGANPGLRIIARAHSDAEVEHLKRYGADDIVLGEVETAREMARHVSGIGDSDLAVSLADAPAVVATRPEAGDGAGRPARA